MLILLSIFLCLVEADILVKLNDRDGSYAVDGMILDGKGSLRIESEIDGSGASEVTLKFWFFDKTKSKVAITVTDGIGKVYDSSTVDENEIYNLTGSTISVDFSKNSDFRFALFFRRKLADDDQIEKKRSFYAVLKGDNDGREQVIGDPNTASAVTFFAPERGADVAMMFIKPTQLMPDNCVVKMYSGGEPSRGSLSAYLLQNVDSSTDFYGGYIFTFATTLSIPAGCQTTVIVNSTIYAGTGVWEMSSPRGYSFVMSRDYPGRIDGIETEKSDVAVAIAMNETWKDYKKTVFAANLFRFNPGTAKSRLFVQFQVGNDPPTGNFTFTDNLYSQTFNGTGDSMQIGFYGGKSDANFLLQFEINPVEKPIPSTTPKSSNRIFRFSFLFLCFVVLIF